MMFSPHVPGVQGIFGILDWGLLQLLTIMNDYQQLLTNMFT